jgi:hypothetical protein
VFGRLARATTTLPNSPKKGSSARLRREAQIELRSSTRLSSPRNRAPRTPRSQPATSLSLISLLFLSLFPTAPSAAAELASAESAARRRRATRRCPSPQSSPPPPPQSSPARGRHAALLLEDDGLVTSVSRKVSGRCATEVGVLLEDDAAARDLAGQRPAGRGGRRRRRTTLPAISPATAGWPWSH